SSPTVIRDQSATIDLYTPFFKAVPERLKKGGLTTIEILSFETWASPQLQIRLREVADRGTLSVLLWPLTRHLEYVNGSLHPDFIRLHGLCNEKDLERDIEEAIAPVPGGEGYDPRLPRAGFSCRPLGQALGVPETRRSR